MTGLLNPFFTKGLTASVCKLIVILSNLGTEALKPFVKRVELIRDELLDYEWLFKFIVICDNKRCVC